MPQELSLKDASLFRQVVRHCENRQYKKGIKSADQILKRNPAHADTQAMKALILCNQGQHQEAFALAKESLRNDMRSHVCWHVYGLLYRSEKKYDDAIKAYLQANRIDPTNPTVLRDLALLQAQIRDFQGFVKSRAAILQQRASFRMNWTGLAVAHHLAGNYAEAEKVLSTYEETLKTPPPRSDLENSEALLYKNTIIAESGDTARALEHLNQIEKQCSDIQAMKELRADYLMKLDRKEEAKNAYVELLDRNPDNSDYYDGLVKAIGVNLTNQVALKAIYDEWAHKYPRSDGPRRIPLEFLEGDLFREAADTYLQAVLKKDVPSTFTNIKGLYVAPSKRAIVGDLVEGYAAGKVKLPESSVYYFLAQHYNYHLTQDLSKALEYIDKALALFPDSLEYNMTKARIYKHQGDAALAAETMEKTRQFDVKDRYVNTKTAKYQLRNNENEAALKTMSLFARNDAVGGTLGDLYDIQCLWFFLEDGGSYLRQRNIGPALKRFSQVPTIFDIFYDDQFDFHNFSLRKGMIRAYVDMVRWQDHIREHPFFVCAAKSAVKAYILLHDKPELQEGPDVDSNGKELSDADRKRLMRKIRKDHEKMQTDAAAKRAAHPNKSGDVDQRKEDDDPLGEKLTSTKTPMEDAMRYLAPLLKFSPKDIDVQNLGFDVFIRKNDPLLAVKCLGTAHALDKTNKTTLENIPRFEKYLSSRSEPLPDPVSEAVNAEFKPLLSA